MRETDFPIDHLLSADEVWLTNAVHYALVITIAPQVFERTSIDAHQFAFERLHEYRLSTLRPPCGPVTKLLYSRSRSDFQDVLCTSAYWADNSNAAVMHVLQTWMAVIPRSGRSLAVSQDDGAILNPFSTLT